MAGWCVIISGAIFPEGEGPQARANVINCRVLSGTRREREMDRVWWRHYPGTVPPQLIRSIHFLAKDSWRPATYLRCRTFTPDCQSGAAYAPCPNRCD